MFMTTNLYKLQHNDYKQRTRNGECTTGPDRTCASKHLSVHSDDGISKQEKKSINIIYINMIKKKKKKKIITYW